MTTLQKLFTFSIRWNILESVCYQALFFGHQWALYHTLSAAHYGKIGTLFSLIYLAIAVSNLGLDSSISPFFAHASQSKYAAARLIIFPSALQYLITACIAILGVYGLSYVYTSIPLPIYILLACIFVTESIKKTTRVVLQCAFKNNITTTIELGTIMSYISLVWMLYFSGNTLDVDTIFIPMAITSLMSLMCLLYVLYGWYQELPEDGTPVPSIGQVIHHRTCAYVTQLTSMFFSANLLVPLFAYKFGIEYSAVLKFVSHVNYFVHTIMHKVFGISLQSCFAAIKHQSMATKQRFFNISTYYLYQLLYSICIFLLINSQRILALKYTYTNQDTLFIGYLFFIFLLVENFLIAHEQLYQVEERTGYLSICNLGSIGIMLVLMYSSYIQSALTFLLYFTILRICTIALLGYIAFYLWGIRINIKPNATITISSLVISLLFFLAIT